MSIKPFKTSPNITFCLLSCYCPCCCLLRKDTDLMRLPVSCTAPGVHSRQARTGARPLEVCSEGNSLANRLDKHPRGSLTAFSISSCGSCLLETITSPLCILSQVLKWVPVVRGAKLFSSFAFWSWFCCWRTGDIYFWSDNLFLGKALPCERLSWHLGPGPQHLLL